MAYGAEQCKLTAALARYQVEQVRDERGRFAPGSSGNTSGRPRGAAGVARKILEQTREGDELVEWALEVWRDTKRTHTERAAMHAWLADRALGRPSGNDSLTLRQGEPDASYDVSQLDDAELRATLEKLRAAKRLTAAPMQATAPGSQPDGVTDDNRRGIEPPCPTGAR